MNSKIISEKETYDDSSLVLYDEIYDVVAQTIPKSNEILERAKKVCLSFTMTGPYRDPKNVFFVDRGKGAKIWDVDGNEYLDVTMGYGPLILGHAPDIVIEATQRIVSKGTSFVIANEHEVKMAELMKEAIPCAERVAFCNSGTEATMHAIRIARGTTGKTKIATFEGAYHGVHDYALVGSFFSPGAGPKNAPIATTDCLGVPECITDTIIKLGFDCDESIERIRELKDELAVVLIEPIPSVYPRDISDFLRKLREVTKECGVLLLFDEVVSGFRCAYGGAQERYDIIPDMATYGKIMGGGYPVGAVVGTSEAMESIISNGDPIKDVEDRKVTAQGTFNANPVSMHVGATVLAYLRDNPDIYSYIDNLTTQTKSELHEFAKANNYPFELIGEYSWFLPYLGDKPFEHARDMHNEQHYVRNVIYCNYLRYFGIAIPDFHIAFYSTEHTEDDIQQFVDTSKKVLSMMRKQKFI